MTEPPTKTDRPTKVAPPEGAPNETHLFVAPGIGAEAAHTPACAPTDRYELQAEIAHGGIGVVFAARDRLLNREVAIKVLREEQRDSTETARRFLEEARITGQLQHPGIPPVHDLGTLPDGRLFIAMKFIHGRTLAAELRAIDRQAELPRLLGIFERICETVGFAHSKGIVHRDLKPANVMVGEFGEVQVMDWGLAKVLTDPAETPSPVVESTPAASQEPTVAYDSQREPSSQTVAGSVLGTPAYMAPEQAQGLVDKTDSRSDVFALGCILCELLAGDPPYLGTWQVVRAMAVTAQLGPAFERLDASGVDREVIDLTKRCLSAPPDARPADGGAVAAMVAAHRAGVTERLRKAEVARAEAGIREAEVRKRRKVQLALAAAGFLLVLAGGAVAWWEDRQAAARKAEANRVEAAALATREREEARTREAVLAAIAEAETALQNDDLTTATAAVARGTARLGDTGPEDLRALLAAPARDVEMVDALDILADAQRTGRRGTLVQRGETLKDYADVFHRYGFDLHAGDPIEMASRMNRSPIRAHLLAGLDAALGRYAISQYSVPVMLTQLLQRVDTDATRTRLRAAILARDGQRILTQVRELNPADLTPGFAVLIGRQYDLPDADRLRVLLAAAERYPSDFRLHELLCSIYLNSGAPGTGMPSAAALTAAHTQAQILVALRPNSPTSHYQLGRVHRRAGRINEAIAAYQKAAELTPTPEEAASLRSQIGHFIRERSGPAAFLQYFRSEVARTPDDAYAHANLGRALHLEKAYDEAVACFRKATELHPAEGTFYSATARALLAKGDPDGAIAAYKFAAERAHPRSATHTQGFAQVLVLRGRYREAVEVQEKLIHDFPAAARASDMRIRYDAACAAASAGTLGGKDPFPAAEWPEVRKKALNWLREELAAWRDDFALNPARARRAVHTRTLQTLADTHFARLRHPLYLATLPPQEASDWIEFWNDLRLLRDETETHVAPSPRAMKSR